VNSLRGWRSVIADHHSYDELVLWFEHDLFDQLNLVQILSWLPGHVSASKTVSLVCIGSHPAPPRFKGLGELTPGEIAPLLETRQLVNDDLAALFPRMHDGEAGRGRAVWRRSLAGRCASRAWEQPVALGRERPANHADLTSRRAPGGLRDSWMVETAT